MPFQIKDFASIVAAQINHARSVTTKVTDFQPGSVVRTLMEAPAVEVEELYLQMFLGLREAIPVATFLSFGFERRPAARAHGFVSISSETPPAEAIPIAAGTTFTSTDARIYTSTAAAVWLAGEDSVRVPVEYGTAGIVGNISQGQITSSSTFGVGYTISNAAIVTGRDIETDAEREARFAEFIQSLSRGTVAACLYAARQASVLDADGNIAEYVTRVGLDEQPGRVSIYVYSSMGVPSNALTENGQALLDGSRNETTGEITPGYRAAGVRVDVFAMVERLIPLSIQVEMLAGATLSAAVEQQIGDIFDYAVRSVAPGETLYLGSLITDMLAVSGVKSIVPSTNANFVCAVTEALIPGALTITAL